MADARRRDADDATGGIPSALTAQGDGKEVAGSAVMVRAEKPQQRLCAPDEGEAGPDPSQGRKTDSLEVLPAQVGACPHGCVSEERRQSAGRPLLVVRPGQQLWCATNA